MTPEDERALEHAARMGIRQRMRPPKPRTGWALVVLAVAVVLLFGLGLWVAVPWQTEPLRPSDREVVHELAQAYLAKHPSVRGPPEAYREEARRIEHAVPRTAAERLTRALALDPDDVSAWLHLVVLSSRSQAVQELGPIQAREVVAAILETRPEATLLPAAQAWLQIQAECPGAARRGVRPGASRCSLGPAPRNRPDRGGHHTSGTAPAGGRTHKPRSL